MERQGSGDCGSGWLVPTLESGPLDQVEPVAAALLPEDLVVTAEAPVGAPVGAPGDEEQLRCLHGGVPVQSRPWVGRHQLC